MQRCRSHKIVSSEVAVISDRRQLANLICASPHWVSDEERLYAAALHAIIPGDSLNHVLLGGLFKRKGVVLALFHDGSPLLSFLTKTLLSVDVDQAAIYLIRAFNYGPTVISRFFWILELG